MSAILDTERLVLRKLTVNDAGFIAGLLNTPTWLRFIGDRGVRTIADAQSYIMKGPLISYTVHGFGLYLVELKATAQSIGMCGILKRDSLEVPDIGYALLPEFENKGYAYEVASATVDHAFKELHLLKLAAITDIDNDRSVRLLERLDFKFQKMLEIDGKELMLFEKSARER
jgi:[ribosomal protein S5]-alanine N-acetyltransferase